MSATKVEAAIALSNTGERKRFALGSLIALSVLGLLAVVGRLTDGVEERTDLMSRFKAPSLQHLLGTDHFGRDVLALLGAGAIRSLGLAAAVVGINACLGTVFALVGSAGRKRRVLFVSISDVFLAIPTLVVALVVAATLGSGTGALIIALASLGWTPYFRLVLSQIDAARENLWVEAAFAGGATSARVLWRHIFPNVSAPLVAMIAVRFGHSIVAVSSLSFLGVGPQPPSPEWGATLAAAQPHAERAPWAVLGPSVAILASTAVLFVIGRLLTARLTK